MTTPVLKPTAPRFSCASGTRHMTDIPAVLLGGWSSTHSPFEQETANQSCHRGTDHTWRSFSSSSAPSPDTQLVNVCLHQIFIPAFCSRFLSAPYLRNAVIHPQTLPPSTHLHPQSLSHHSTAVLAHFKPLQIKSIASPMLQFSLSPPFASLKCVFPSHTSKALLSLICTLRWLAFICL